MTSIERHRSPVIDDLRVKMCWICREEENHGDEPPRPSRTWVHPCTCTLIAHQDCLLEWIKESQSQPSRRENALKCPQCSTRYVIDSRNPLVLRWMERVDRLASQGGKYTTLAIVAGLGVSFAGSVYGLCTLYGAHAVRLYVGDQLYGVIVGHDPKDWDWKVYLNLPLVPFYLIASRLRIFDSVITTTTLPLLLSFTIPAPSTLAAAHEPLGLPRFLTVYPPTPWICVLLYPLLRIWYIDMRDRLTHWALKTQRPDRQTRPGAPARRHTWVLENDNEHDRILRGADVRIDLDVLGPAPRHQENAAQGGNNGDGEAEMNRDPNQNPDPGHRRIRLTFSSLGRFIGGALAIPYIAKYMGALLELASRRSLLLRRVLAVEKSHVPGYGWVENVARESGALARLHEAGIKTPWATWDQLTPIWWRNSLGLGLWIVARDAVTVLHLFLKKREMTSRRIMSRSFAGIDVGTLDLIAPTAF